MKRRWLEAICPGFDLKVALADPDPDLRAAAVHVVPRPTPPALRDLLAHAVTSDADDKVALGAAQALCGDDPVAAQAALGAQGIDRIKKLVVAYPKRATRDANRCLAR